MVGKLVAGFVLALVALSAQHARAAPAALLEIDGGIGPATADFIKRGIRANAICPGTIESPSLDDRIAALAARFDAVSRTAVARTKAMLNARLGDLVAAAMDREERACLELFDSPDARAALEAFAHRRR
jgi:hypothetical protein